MFIIAVMVNYVLQDCIRDGLQPVNRSSIIVFNQKVDNIKSPTQISATMYNEKKYSACNSGSKIFLGPSQLFLFGLIDGDVSQVHRQYTLIQWICRMHAIFIH